MQHFTTETGSYHYEMRYVISRSQMRAKRLHNYSIKLEYSLKLTGLIVRVELAKP